LPDKSETQILEFKESWRDEYLRTICAFANSTGGKLVIGKDDNGNLVGLKSSKCLLEDIPNKVELWGRGIDKMIESCRAEEMPEPQFSIEASGFWVTFRFASDQTTTSKTTSKATSKTTPKISTAKRIVELIEENPEITRKEMAAILGITLDGIKYHLQKLKAAGKIHHTGPARSGRWQIKS